MRRVLGLCVVLLVLGCGGSTPKKAKSDSGADGGTKDATGTTDVGGIVDRVQEAPPSDVVPDEASDDGGATSDASSDDADGAASDAADASNDAGDSLGDAGDVGETAPPRMVGFSFTGQVVTVARKGGTGLPLGFDNTVRTKAIAGSLTYDPTLTDLTVAGDRGKYEAAGRATFTLTLEGKTLTGSMRAQLQVENLATSDTFRYLDGPQPVDNTVRIMKVDGVDAPKLSLFIAISDGTTMFTTDKLPDPFPAIDITMVTHTFSLEDDGGTLLLQLDTLVPK